MHLREEELEKKWWHRLAKVLRWVFAIFVFIIIMTLAIQDQSKDAFVGGIFTGIMSGALAYYFFSWLYRDVILYIIFGKEEKK